MSGRVVVEGAGGGVGRVANESAGGGGATRCEVGGRTTGVAVSRTVVVGRTAVVVGSPCVVVVGRTEVVVGSPCVVVVGRTEVVVGSGSVRRGTVATAGEPGATVVGAPAPVVAGGAGGAGDAGGFDAVSNVSPSRVTR